MGSIRWAILVAGVCLPVALLAIGARVPFLDAASGLPVPRAVPAGDREIAWLHTSTSGATWERFVAGVVRSAGRVPGLRVDDANAFPARSTDVPELVLAKAGEAGSIRIRWYKLSGEGTPSRWAEALAARDPAPLAVIGGVTSDRAADLAAAMNARNDWHGERPLLFLTTATAEDLSTEADDDSGPLGSHRSLLSVYPDRTFRFCFTNRQMADSVLDFVWDNTDLRPISFAELARMAVISGVAGASECPGGICRPAERPTVFTVSWQDDPFSTDLHWQFAQATREKLRRLGDNPAEPVGPPVSFASWGVPFSVGGQTRPNAYEARVVESMLQQYAGIASQRSLLVLPTVTNPARRLLRALYASAPNLRYRLVAVTGDGISVNAVFRDGEFAWPLTVVPVPLVLFAHNNPVAWDEPSATVPYPLLPPTATDEVLHFADMATVIAEAAFADGPVPGPNEFAIRLRTRCPAFFDNDGNRLGGTGEYVVVVRPRVTPGIANRNPDPIGVLAVWRRGETKSWELVRELEIDQWQTRAVPGGRE